LEGVTLTEIYTGPYFESVVSAIKSGKQKEIKKGRHTIRVLWFMVENSRVGTVSRFTIIIVGLKVKTSEVECKFANPNPRQH